MLEISYRASVIHEVYTLAEENPEWTIGEILHSFTRRKILGKSLVTATDEDLYNAIEKFREIERYEE